MIRCKGSKKFAIRSNSTRKKMRFRKISSQKFDPMGEFFHDSAIQMQAFIAFAAQKFGINENTFYLCNVRTFVFDYPGRIPRGVRLYRYCPIYREPSFNDCSLFLFVLHHEVLKIRIQSCRFSKKKKGWWGKIWIH